MTIFLALIGGIGITAWLAYKYGATNEQRKAWKEIKKLSDEADEIRNRIATLSDAELDRKLRKPADD